MTTKYLKFFIITTLISYVIMFTLLSSNGLIHYLALKHDVEVQQKDILELESDVISLKKYKQELINGDYILDNALKLGYVNSNDKVYIYEYNKLNEPPRSLQTYIDNQSNVQKVTKNKSNSFFLLISALIGIVTTLSFSVVSKKRK